MPASKRKSAPSTDVQTTKRARTRNSAKTNDTNATSEPPKRTRLRGRLASIMTLPVDVFCEIACHLSPEDLLRMARASKSLRSLLMARSSRLIWSAAEQGVGLPQCPPDLSCPQYASLVFDKFCMHCLAPRAKSVDIYARARLCQSCYKVNMVPGYDVLPPRLPLGVTIRDLAALVPGDRPYLATDWLGYVKKQCHDWGRQRYYKPLIAPACEKYLRTSRDEKTLVEMSQSLHELYMHALDVKGWFKRKREDKERALRELTESRRTSIYRRLEELGYSAKDYKNISSFEGSPWHTLVEQPRLLTEKGWLAMKPQLEEMIRKKQEEEIEVSRRQCRVKRKKGVFDLTTTALAVDGDKQWNFPYHAIFALSVVKNFIEADGFDATICEDDEQTIKTAVLQLWSESERENIEYCTDSMLAAFADCGISSANLGSIGAPDVLEHICAFFKNPYISRPAVSYRQVTLDFSLYSGKKLFESVVPHIDAIKTAKKLSEDLDIGHITLERIAALGDVFACARCDGIRNKTLSWSKLVEHFLDYNEDYRVKKYRYGESAETFLADDHNLEDRSFGACAVHIMNGETGKELAVKCECETCSNDGPSKTTFTCGVCSHFGKHTLFKCKDRMYAHVRNRHGPLSPEELAKKLGIGAVWFKYSW